MSTVELSHDEKLASRVMMTNAVVADAKSLPDLITKVESVNPDLAAAMVSKPLIASKTPWGVLLVTAITYGASKYGLGWDETTCDLVGGFAILAGSYFMRWVSSSRIAGVFRAKFPI